MPIQEHSATKRGKDCDGGRGDWSMRRESLGTVGTFSFVFEHSILSSSLDLDMPKTYSVIPHAASGSAAHTGRGGFPGPHRIIAALVNAISPKTANRVYSFVAEDPQARSLRWAHPFQSVEQAVGPSMKSKRDAEEAKHAERVKWLPPGVRGVVVGRNSQIYDEELDVEDLELFAAIEYRALSLLTGLLLIVSFE
jgi:hypothetical protein